MKDNISFFIAAVLLQQQLTVHSNNNIVVLENETRYICKHHEHAFLNKYIYMYLLLFSSWCRSNTDIQKTQPIYGFSNNRSDYRCNTSMQHIIYLIIHIEAQVFISYNSFLTRHLNKPSIYSESTQGKLWMKWC